MKIKKLIACILACTVMVTCFASCSGGDDAGIDKTKSQLYVGVVDTGYGTLWMENSAKEFEAYYANTEFEPGTGKKGVQVIIEKKLAEFDSGVLQNSMPNLNNSVYFLGKLDYDTFIAKDLLLDITDTIKEKVYDDNGDLVGAGVAGTKSILDTMNSDLVGYHERNGKYYAIPGLMYTNSIVYDADLFNEKGYYFDNQGKMGMKQADIDKGENGNIGPGPDGKVGTPDDGMPATYSDFKKLLNKMVENGVTPFTWAGGTFYQVNFAYNAIFANYEGYNDYKLNWTFNGTTSEGQAVSESNLEPLIEQEGRRAAIQFFYDICNKSDYYSKLAANNAHTDALFEYINSVNATGANKRIAMCFEGGYWEREAITHFNNAASVNPDMGYGKRDFRMLPIPNFDGQTITTEEEVLVGKGAESLLCLAKQFKSDNPELQTSLAKLFLQFFQSRSQLSNFVRDSGACFRLYDFKPTDAERASWTKFAQNIYSYIENGSKIVTNLTESKKRKNIYDGSEFSWEFYYTAGAGKAYTYPTAAFQHVSGLTVDNCFKNVQDAMRSFANL